MFIEFSKDPVVCDETLIWNLNIGYTVTGIGEMTILDAQKSGVYRLQIERMISEAA